VIVFADSIPGNVEHTIWYLYKCDTSYPDSKYAQFIVVFIALC